MTGARNSRVVRRAALGLGVRADMAEQPGIVGNLFARREEIAGEIVSKGLLPARGIMLADRRTTLRCTRDIS